MSKENEVFTDDLVKRLRSMLEGDMRPSPLGKRAADRIEELEAENKRLRLEAAHANDTADVAIERAKELEANINIKADFIDATINQLAASDQRIEELEAKLERAECLLVDAMVQLGNGKIKLRRECAYLIGKFLAELKGQDDE